MISWAGVAARKAVVAPNPTIAPDLAASAALPVEHEWLRDRGLPVVIGVGRLSVEKDWPTLLRAFATVRRSRPCRLVLLGDGPAHERQRVVAQAGELGIGAELSLPGHVANPYAFVARAAVLAHTARVEGMPNVLIEALALGTPVVATDGPTGAREVLEGGRWGSLVPVGDAAAVARAIAAVLTAGGRASPEAQEAMARRFSVAAAAEAYGRLLFDARVG